MPCEVRSQSAIPLESTGELDTHVIYIQHGTAFFDIDTLTASNAGVPPSGLPPLSNISPHVDTLPKLMATHLCTCVHMHGAEHSSREQSHGFTPEATHFSLTKAHYFALHTS